MRKELFPSLMDTYQHWVDTDDNSKILEHSLKSKGHWIKIADLAVKLYQQHGSNANTAIEEMIKNNSI
jgi:hypothetical protein